MAKRRVQYFIGAELPDLTVVWRDSSKQLVNFSAGYTFSLTLTAEGDEEEDAVLTKSSGITGLAVSPNVRVVWSAGDLQHDPGDYEVKIVARSAGNRDRIAKGVLELIA